MIFDKPQQLLLLDAFENFTEEMAYSLFESDAEQLLELRDSAVAKLRNLTNSTDFSKAEYHVMYIALRNHRDVMAFNDHKEPSGYTVLRKKLDTLRAPA